MNHFAFLLSTNQKNSMLSAIGYHDYLVLLCYMDAEWTRRKPFGAEPDAYEPVLRGLLHFTQKCHKYRDDINDNYRAFCHANDTEWTGPVASYYFEPLCYFPFGHADDLAIVLLDDFDPVHYLTSDIRTTLEEVCLACCPKVSSFSVGTHESALCELHTLLCAEPRLPKDERDGRSERPLVVHEFQETTPLLVFTKYKMDGLAAVGHSLLFQQALFKAMGIRIHETTTLLKEKVVVDKTVATLMRKEDVDSVKCTFLDLQGSEEVGTLIFCRNYSVAMTFVAALRSLTFGDVFKADVGGNIERVLSHSKVHQSIIRLSQKLSQRGQGSDISLLRDNHIFRWTHSSLAVSPKARIRPEQSNCNGYVEALPEFQIAPGHCLNVEEKVAVTPGKQRERASIQDTARVEYHRFQVGNSDLILPYASTIEETQLPVLTLVSVLSLVEQNLHTFGTREARKDHGRDVVDIATGMVIPVPEIVESSPEGQVSLICRKLGEQHFPPLMSVLPLIQERLCYLKDAKHTEGDEEETLGPRAGRLNLTELKKVPRTYGVPVSLRRTIEYLYQDFATLIADPFLFDAVLDLYDTFATLHAVLTRHLPSERECELGGNDGDLGTLDEKRTEQLSMLVEAIHNALMHRITQAYPEAHIREKAIDFRGGLSQIMHAADAPVKCGLGLLRKYALPGGKVLNRDSVGGITRIGFVPGVRCYSLNFGVEKYAKLAYFEADVPHVLHAPSYCDNLHESFHLIFDALRDRPDSNIHKLRFPNSVMEDRVSEIFANVMCHLFLFGSDVGRFLYYNMCCYSKSLSSVGWDDCETIVRFTELLIRLFLVKDAIPSGEAPRDYNNTWLRKGEGKKTALGRFKEMVGDFGPFFSEYNRLWNGTNGVYAKSYCWNQFKKIYPEMSVFMPNVWSDAIDIYRQFEKDQLCYKDGSYKYNDEEIRRNITQGLVEGKPLIRSLYRNSRYNVSGCSGVKHSKGAEYISLDALVLICNMLRQEIPSFVDVKGKAIHLYRRPEYRTVEYPKEVEYLKAKNQLWNEFQLDKGAAAMFCPVPSARRERLRMHIVMLKTFWDIASGLKARRLWEILSDNWPESELLAQE